MGTIRSSVIVGSDEFRANCAAHLKLIAEFRALEAKVREVSGRADSKFRSRGQLPPRERINWLVDRDTPFLELSSLCGLGMHEDDGAENVFGGGLIVGVGFISGVRAMIAANDSGIKGGAAHPMGVEKAIRAQEIALENKLPYVQLVESAGANLLLQAEMFVRGGATFANMARLSAAGIPVVSVVHGSSTAGGAYQTGLADYVVMVRGRSKVFLAGPPLLKAATGEIAGDEALGGAELHYATTGLGEYLAEDDADALRIGREILARLSWSAPPKRSRAPPPLYDPEELLGVVPIDYRKPYDVREVVARIVDGSDFLDFKPAYGGETVCGHAAIEGRPVGLIGNNGPIDSSGSSKAGQFIQLCCQAGLPILFLQNTTGYLVGVDAETSGIVK
ncbi:MAG: acyl-CoA carboxylase subunit beta, partial [Hyphomicrobiales bacterium]|nr:acyl-CoA carboxylase subunit beta [Hyphomicrobiales bacterium]